MNRVFYLHLNGVRFFLLSFSTKLNSLYEFNFTSTSVKCSNEIKDPVQAGKVFRKTPEMHVERD